MKAILVIDMLKDFIEKNGALYCGITARKIIPFIKTKIKNAHRTNTLVIYVCDSHKEDDLEFKMFPKHCIEGTTGAEIIDELKPKEEDIIIKKTRYSAFYKTNLEQILQEKNINEVEVVGVCTSICVMDTVGELRNRDIKVTVFKNGVADFDKEAHKFAIRRMEKIYGAIIK